MRGGGGDRDVLFVCQESRDRLPLASVGALPTCILLEPPLHKPAIVCLPPHASGRMPPATPARPYAGSRADVIPHLTRHSLSPLPPRSQGPLGKIGLRKSVHKKAGDVRQTTQAPADAGAPKGPPSAYGNVRNNDKIGDFAMVKKDTQRQSSSRFNTSTKIELTKLPSLKDAALKVPPPPPPPPPPPGPRIPGNLFLPLFLVTQLPSSLGTASYFSGAGRGVLEVVSWCTPVRARVRCVPVRCPGNHSCIAISPLHRALT